MAESGRTSSPLCEGIKQGLDPAYSYMIFERAAGASHEDQYAEVLEILEKLDLRIHRKEFLPDDARKTLLLVVQFDPGRTDEILQEFMNEGLPRDIIYYVYGSRFRN